MRHGSLFSGIGGFDLAAEWMGWENVFHCEWNEFGKKVLKYYWPNAISYDDITKTDFTIHRGSIDILTGGFPCTDLSIANRHNGGGGKLNGERSGLWKEYARAIWEIRPRYILIENSPMLITGGLDRILLDLSGMGYDAEWRSFYATQFGFNHGRKRTYILAYPRNIRSENYFKSGGILCKILQKQPPRQNIIPVSFKRFNGSSNFNDVQLNDGFSRELDKDSIMAYGNAIIPQIAFEIFKAIQQFIDENQ